MKCLAIQSSPNLDGLTATLARAVLRGYEEGGGSGGGAVRALLNLEGYLRRVGFDVFDLVPVTKFSKDHKLTDAGGRRKASRH
jgi:hypothetical protein